MMMADMRYRPIPGGISRMDPRQSSTELKLYRVSESCSYNSIQIRVEPDVKSKKLSAMVEKGLVSLS